MLTNKERIAAMHMRAKELNSQRWTRRIRLLQSAFSTFCFAVVILIAAYMPRIVPSQMSPADGSSEDMHASLFAGSGALGYIVIAIIAFLLGITVTIFCFYLKKWQEEKEQEKKRM